AALPSRARPGRWGRGRRPGIRRGAEPAGRTGRAPLRRLPRIPLPPLVPQRLYPGGSPGRLRPRPGPGPALLRGQHQRGDRRGLPARRPVRASRSPPPSDRAGQRRLPARLPPPPHHPPPHPPPRGPPPPARLWGRLRPVPGRPRAGAGLAPHRRDRPAERLAPADLHAVLRGRPSIPRPRAEALRLGGRGGAGRTVRSRAGRLAAPPGGAGPRGGRRAARPRLRVHSRRRHRGRARDRRLLDPGIPREQAPQAGAGARAQPSGRGPTVPGRPGRRPAPGGPPLHHAPPAPRPHAPPRGIPETTAPGTVMAERTVVWISHRVGERCAGCAAEVFAGDFIQITRETGIRCATCAGLADLVYLPAGDPALTRRAVALSSRAVMVVKFFRARRRHERPGMLVAQAALQRAQEECAADTARREAARARRRPREARAEQEYLVRFTERVLALFPGCPRAEAEAIAQHTCTKYSGRVGRSAAAKAFEAEAVMLAVRAHIRHHATSYEQLLAQGLEPFEARPLVAAQIETHLAEWRRLQAPADLSSA